jgi:hypothetical protein
MLARRVQPGGVRGLVASKSIERLEATVGRVVCRDTRVVRVLAPLHVVLEWQHKGVENLAFLKVTPWSARSERVVSIWLSV